MKTILVVDDTNAQRKLISALLTHAGFETANVESAKLAWEWLENNDFPDLNYSRYYYARRNRIRTMPKN
ncbi:response regulator [Crocosphaera watsonii]|uniref:Response regulator receiver n=1 Tax=Crocosphaera watsonii WH 8502 TaxID=423474 RepID=T2IJ86_CROWT|nr:response regulator [Crocosphaera watsonii]CCQ53621.1 Response regulator receiver [Crocosphaera watsonii WH 8502]